MDEMGEILWKKKNGVLGKIEDREWPAGRPVARFAKPLNAGAVGIGDPARRGEDPLKLESIEILRSP